VIATIYKEKLAKATIRRIAKETNVASIADEE